MKKKFDWTEGLITKRWTKFPKIIFRIQRDFELSTCEFKVLVFLMSKYPTHTFSDSVIAGELGVNRATINKAIHSLKKKELINFTKVQWKGFLIKSFSLSKFAFICKRLDEKDQEEKRTKRLERIRLKEEQEKKRLCEAERAANSVMDVKSIRILDALNERAEKDDSKAGKPNVSGNSNKRSV